MFRCIYWRQISPPLLCDSLGYELNNLYLLSSYLSHITLVGLITYRPPSFRFITSDKGRGKCFCPCLFVCLSVCLLTRILKKRWRAWIRMNVACRHADVGTWTNWLTFDPDPDHSPNAGTGLLSPISYKRCYVEFYVEKIPLAARRYSEPWF